MVVGHEGLGVQGRRVLRWFSAGQKQWNKWPAVVASYQHAVHELQQTQPDAPVAVVLFGAEGKSKVAVDVSKASELTGDELKSVDCDMYTEFYDAWRAVHAFVTATPNKFDGKSLHCVFITDGQDEHYDAKRSAADKVNELCAAVPVATFTGITLGPVAKCWDMQQISNAFAANRVHVKERTLGDLDGLRTSLKQFVAESSAY